MPPLELSLVTDDKDFIKDLKAQAFKDITISTRVFTTDSVPIEVKAFICRHILTILDGAAAALFATWLKDRLRKKQPHKTVINGIDVSHDPGQVTIIINNIIQQNNVQIKQNKTAK